MATIKYAQLKIKTITIIYLSYNFGTMATIKYAKLKPKNS